MASLPFIAEYPSTLSTAERERLDQLARRLSAEEPALRRTDFFGPTVQPGLGDGPKLLFEDHGEVHLFSDAGGDTSLKCRPLLLAGDNDVVIIEGERFHAFEAYCRDVLGLGEARVLSIPNTGREIRAPMPLRCAEHPQILPAIANLARESGEINIVPYIGTGSVWRLAQAVAAASGVTVNVAAPPPRLCRRVNDKLWFAQRVAEVLGRAALPATRTAFGPAALTAQVAAIAQRYDRVVVKVPDSAGSLGNFVLDAIQLRPLAPHDLRNMLLDQLRQRGAAGVFPLMVSVWDAPVVSSPSVQIWIPQAREGLPIIEGIFEQIITGPSAEFVGARPSTAPSRVLERIAREASKLAYLLQSLGYFGRCSFDSVLVGDDLDDAELHWLECNGRWGGVSVPMTLVNRLTGRWMRHPFVVVQRTGLSLAPHTFEWAVEALADRLLTPGSDVGVVFLSPGYVVRGEGEHLIGIAHSVAAAEHEVEMALRALTSGSF
ncbi:MAG: hypothetical protein ACTSX7_16030 [Alphaproteobacteria bacterium]